MCQSVKILKQIWTIATVHMTPVLAKGNVVSV